MHKNGETDAVGDGDGDSEGDGESVGDCEAQDTDDHCRVVSVMSVPKKPLVPPIARIAVGACTSASTELLSVQAAVAPGISMPDGENSAADSRREDAVYATRSAYVPGENVAAKHLERMKEPPTPRRRHLAYTLTATATLGVTTMLGGSLHPLTPPPGLET